VAYFSAAEAEIYKKEHHHKRGSKNFDTVNDLKNGFINCRH
jgi:hypothetical protein